MYCAVLCAVLMFFFYAAKKHNTRRNSISISSSNNRYHLVRVWSVVCVFVANVIFAVVVLKIKMNRLTNCLISHIKFYAFPPFILCVLNPLPIFLCYSHRQQRARGFCFFEWIKKKTKTANDWEQLKTLHRLYFLYTILCTVAVGCIFDMKTAFCALHLLRGSINVNAYIASASAAAANSIHQKWNSINYFAMRMRMRLHVVIAYAALSVFVCVPHKM